MGEEPVKETETELAGRFQEQHDEGWLIKTKGSGDLTNKTEMNKMRPAEPTTFRI